MRNHAELEIQLCVTMRNEGRRLCTIMRKL